MIPSRKYAEIAAASLAKMLKAGTDSGKVADIVESVLAEATREHEDQEHRHLAEVEAAAEVKLARLLDASPAVIYSFKARDDFAPLFVSQNISRRIARFVGRKERRASATRMTSRTRPFSGNSMPRPRGKVRLCAI